MAIVRWHANRETKYSNECKRVVIGDEAYRRNQINPRCKSCRVLRSRLQSCDSTGIKLQKSVARKRRTVNVIKQCKRLKTTQVNCRINSINCHETIPEFSIRSA
ncbi:uncharacterized protein LOC128667802 [Microplitis demolitor]|uniref:uncharacterized protein LOC128667802 n=1 Tax=Microplitis demolitor TaxID=69319 RepID=UPI00235B6ECF|nr:uncharacterized protein LOC128667802 [Microplitis demolitor]